eukprot:CAMPEP_0167759072 /NCGR_PEP_ID=MMETSP0110_2-20121227/10819_1 /TAXON_ID=629695 /ORGANISM="Gymnochlora sp., Strain CCMP2014" /LENGTH=164 /DNA_ID=CAMNT_0007645415 /DNA_START=51 /DNA_END=545 /DNA_ORIENTATION=+
MSSGPDEKGATPGMKEQVIAGFNKIVEAINEKTSSIAALKQASEKMKCQPAHIVLGVAAFLFLIIMMMIGFNAIVNIVCFFYPAYAALMSLKTEEKDPKEQWLMYFMIFGLFHVLESFYPDLLTEVTFYVLFKFMVLLWCFLPQSTGAKKIYGWVSPLLKGKTE